MYGKKVSGWQGLLPSNFSHTSRLISLSFLFQLYTPQTWQFYSFFPFLLLEFIKSEEVHSRMGGHVDLSCTRRVTFNPRHFSSKPKQTIALGNSELLAKIGDNTAGMYNLAARPKEYGMRELCEKLKM